MLDLMLGLPPIHPVYPTIVTTSDAITFWVVFGLGVAMVVATIIILAVAGKRRYVQQQSQMKEAELHYAGSPRPESDEQLPVHTPEEKVLLPR